MNIYSMRQQMMTMNRVNQWMEMEKNSKDNPRNGSPIRPQRDEYIPSRNLTGDLYPTYSKNERKDRLNALFVEPVKFTSDDWEDIERDSDILAQKIIENNGVKIADNPEDVGRNTSDMKTNMKKGLTFLEAVRKAEVPLKAREINDLLEDNNIFVDENEEFNITVDKTGLITVTGENEEKAKAIEHVLNASNSRMGWTLNRLTWRDSERYKGLKDNRDIWHEMNEEDFLRRVTNGEVSLRDLALENGEIVGLPNELAELINGTKPNMTEREKIIYPTMKKIITRLLTTGIDNIPDLTSDYIYKKNELIMK